MANALYTRPNVDNAVAEMFGMQPNMDRLNMLPRYDRKQGLIAPNALYQLARAFVSPGVAAQGGYVSGEDAVNFGGNLVGAGLGASAAVPVKGRVLGMNAYHNSYSNFDKFDPAFIGKQTDYGYAGKGFYFTPKELKGGVYGHNTYKVDVDLKNPYRRTPDNWNKDPLNPYTWIAENQEKYGSLRATSEAWTNMMKEKGFDGFIDEAVENGEIVAFDADKIKILEKRIKE